MSCIVDWLCASIFLLILLFDWGFVAPMNLNFQLLDALQFVFFWGIFPSVLNIVLLVLTQSAAMHCLWSIWWHPTSAATPGVWRTWPHSACQLMKHHSCGHQCACVLVMEIQWVLTTTFCIYKSISSGRPQMKARNFRFQGLKTSSNSSGKFSKRHANNSTSGAHALD